MEDDDLPTGSMETKKEGNQHKKFYALHYYYYYYY